MSYHYSPVRTPKLKNSDSIKCWQGCGETELLYIANENVKWYNYYGKVFDSFQKKTKHTLNYMT